MFGLLNRNVWRFVRGHGIALSLSSLAIGNTGLLASSALAGPLGGSQPVLGAPDLVPSVTDVDYIRFHGRGDVLRTVARFNSCAAFPSGAAADPGSALHARLRIRLAPESEYEILDQTNGGSPASGRVLWTQGLVDQANYAGFTIAYRYDTEDLYFVVGDGGGTVKRTRVWRVSIDLDDGLFRTIDWSYNEASGKASCWIDGVYFAPSSVIKPNGTLDPAPELVGAWHSSGSIMGNVRSDAMYTLAGRGWKDEIGEQNTVWPAPDRTGSDYDDVLDEYISVLGDLSYAAFRWARGSDSVAGGSAWDVELQFDGNTPPVDLANGLDSQSLIHSEIDSILPVWLDTDVGQEITSWVIDDLPDPEDTQTRQILFYHHGLGDQKITVAEDNGSGGALDRSLVCVIGPDGDVEYWAIKTKYSDDDPATQYTLVGQAPTAEGEHTIELPAGQPGVYRILVRSTKNEGYIFSTDQEALYWGAYAPFSLLTQVDALSQGEVFAYIPKDSSQYDLYLEGVTNAWQVEEGTGILENLEETGSLGENGQVQYSGPASVFKSSTNLVRMQLGASWRIGARRFPLVLSGSQFAAERYIRAGVIEMPGFTLWSPDDKRLRDRIIQIGEDGFGDAQIVEKSFQPHSAHIEGNPRAYYSMAIYPQTLKLIHTALEYQVTSPSSAMVGSIDHVASGGSAFLRYGDTTNSQYNFDQFGPAMLFWAGWDDTAANPYYGDANFARRARAASLAFARHVQGTRLRRTDTDVGLHPGLAGLAGADSFGLALHWGRVYGLFDSDDREAILPAAIIQLCHILNVTPTTTRNQDAHFLPFLYEVGQLWAQQNPGSGVAEMLSDIAEEYAMQIIDRPDPWNGADVALQEARAFDGSYSGIQNHMLAMGWLVSGAEFDPAAYDPNNPAALNREWDFLRESLDRQYGFWTRYMAPPIDFGATQMTFAHDSDSRTNSGAIEEQFGGAKRIGSMASPMAARLMLEDGSDIANKLVSGQGVFPENYFDFDLGAPGSSWTELSNGRGGWKFNLLPLYTGGVTHLFDAQGDPIPTGATMPCEAPVAGGSLTVEQIGESFTAINTPSYYAIISTRNYAEPHYYRGALEKYQEPRDIEKTTNNPGGGGDIRGIVYPNGDEAHTGEEIGGVGLSLFYDKTDGGTVISGHNWTPLTTHQTIGYTSDGLRRWAEQNSKAYGTLTTTTNGTAIVEAEMAIAYDLNHSSDYSTSYRIVRTFTFYPESIDIEVEVLYPSSGGAFEELVALYENLPFEVGELVIGAQERVQRLHGLTNLTMPWVGGSVWDLWSGNAWDNNEGLYYHRQEIGWLQKSIPLPQPGVPSTLSYTIGVSNPPSSMGLPDTGSGQGGVDYQEAIWFLRAFERGDPAADLTGDGKVDAEDFRAMFDR